MKTNTAEETAALPVGAKCAITMMSLVPSSWADRAPALVSYIRGKPLLCSPGSPSSGHLLQDMRFSQGAEA